MTFRVTLVPTILFFPFLYLFGWLLAQSLKLFGYDLILNNLSLIGSIMSLGMFFLLIRDWIAIRWLSSDVNKKDYYFHLHKKNSLRNFFVGFSQALSLILLMLIILSFSNLISWDLHFNMRLIINSLFLCLFVGLAEEVIFRGWLWGEMNLVFGAKWGSTFQAIIFSLIHLRLDMELIESIMLFIGLFMLGLVLAQRRNLDRGSLWGCIGFHGGLVGIWFFVQFGLIDLSLETPSWLIGPGEIEKNPIGGLYAIISLLIILFGQRDKEIALLRSFAETCKASSKDDFP